MCCFIWNGPYTLGVEVLRNLQTGHRKLRSESGWLRGLCRSLGLVCLSSHNPLCYNYLLTSCTSWYHTPTHPYPPLLQEKFETGKKRCLVINCTQLRPVRCFEMQHQFVMNVPRCCSSKLVNRCTHTHTYIYVYLSVYTIDTDDGSRGLLTFKSQWTTTFYDLRRVARLPIENDREARPPSWSVFNKVQL